MAAQAQYHDQSTGWTWGGVLKGVAYTVGVVAVGCAIYMGGVAAAHALGFKEAAATMVGLSGSTLAGIGQIPEAFVKMIGGFISPVTDAIGGVATKVTGTVGTAVDTVRDTATGLYNTGAGLVAEHGKTAAVVAGAGAAGYWAGKVGGRKEQAKDFRDQVLKGREQAALNQLGKA